MANYNRANAPDLDEAWTFFDAWRFTEQDVPARDGWALEMKSLEAAPMTIRCGRLVPNWKRAKKIWDRILESQNHRCALCGIGMVSHDAMNPPTLDAATQEHIVPLANGGSTDIENIVATCLRCNQERSDQADMHLKMEPDHE